MLFGVPRVAAIVRRIKERAVRCIFADQLLDVSYDGSVAHEEFVFSQGPTVPGRGDRFLRKLRDRVLIRKPLCRVLCSKEPGQLVVGEADTVDIEAFIIIKSG